MLYFNVPVINYPRHIFIAFQLQLAELEIDWLSLYVLSNL